jgi:hypothetical protein
VLSIVVLVFPQAFPHVTDTGGVPAGTIDVAPPGSLWDGYAYHAGFSLRYGIGLLPTLATPFALAWALASKQPLALLSAVCAVSYFLVVGASPALLARYQTPIVPLLLLLVAGMLVAVARRMATGRGRAVFLTVATLVLAAEPSWTIVAHNRVAARTDTRVLATEWLTANLALGDRVAIVGTEFWGYGEPVMPPGVDAVRAKPDAAALDASGARWIVAHDHPLFSSRVDFAALERAAPRLRLRTEFDPFVAPRGEAVFEEADAYYIPTYGFGAVERPGPHVRIYELRPGSG